jgi:STAS domain
VNSVAANHADKLVVSEVLEAETALVRPDGYLDSSTYHQLRDALIEAAIDQPDGVIVDVSSLVVPAPSAWAVFTSARWHISRWPDTPMALVCAHRRGRDALARCGVSRRLPVFESTGEALNALRRERSGFRRRARVELPRTSASVRESRKLMEEWLTAWSRPELISVAKLVVTVLVENVLAYTESAPAVRLEDAGDVVSVAVEDNSCVLATRCEGSSGGGDVSGLAIVAALCRGWGNAPTSTGKTVWAIIGPENEL